MPPNVVEHDSRPPPYLSRDLTALLNKSEFESLRVSRFVHRSRSRDQTTYVLRLAATPSGYQYELRSCPEAERDMNLTPRQYALLETRRDTYVQERLPVVLREMTRTLERALYAEAGAWTILDNRDERQLIENPDPSDWVYDRDYNCFWATAIVELRRTDRTRPFGDALSWILRGPPDLTNGEVNIFFQTDERYAVPPEQISGLKLYRIEKPSDTLPAVPVQA